MSKKNEDTEIVEALLNNDNNNDLTTVKKDIEILKENVKALGEVCSNISSLIDNHVDEKINNITPLKIMDEFLGNVETKIKEVNKINSTYNENIINEKFNSINDLIKKFAIEIDKINTKLNSKKVEIVENKPQQSLKQQEIHPEIKTETITEQGNIIISTGTIMFDEPKTEPIKTEPEERRRIVVPVRRRK